MSALQILESCLASMGLILFMLGSTLLLIKYMVGED